MSREANHPDNLALDLEKQLLKVHLAAAMFSSGGTVRLGRFDVLRTLGRGGMGSVFEANDSERGERVALKCLTHADADGIYRIKREFRSLASLIHPNLVTLHELFHEGGRWFFTMELVDGTPFDTWIRSTSDEQLQLARLRDGLQQLVVAVTALHVAGKLHCDLKPSNVLVTPDGRVKILDFGLVDCDPVAGEWQLTETCARGTPAYMAPEQIVGRAVESSDWYALGVMLFEALTGQLPFSGDTLGVLRRKQLDDAPRLSDVCAGVPEDLAELCDGLLRRDIATRLDGPTVLSTLERTEPERKRVSPAMFGSLPPAVFVGREREFAILEAGLSNVASGTPGLLLVEGRSGIGKSTLVGQFAEVASEPVLIFRGRCYEQESVPYKVFDGIMDAVSRYLRALPETELKQLLPRRFVDLVQLFPVLGRVRAERSAAAEVVPAARELRNQAFSAFKDLLRELAAQRPVVLIVDDLQWGDADSAHMLAHLIGPPMPPALFFLGAYRSEDVGTSEFLQLLFAPHELQHAVKPSVLQLGPLSADNAAELSRHLLGDLGEQSALVAAIAAESQGIPFFILELAHRIKHHRRSGTMQAAACSSVSLETTIMERAAGLGQQATRLLHVLSVAAGPIEQSVAMDAAAVSKGANAAIAALRAARLMRSSGIRPTDLAETYHDRIRETVVRSLDEAHRRDLHAAIATAMERHGVSDPERLLKHCRGAGDLERAGHFALQAADAATSKLAFNRAAELLKEAIALLPKQAISERRVYELLGDAFANAGRSAHAADAYLKAADEQEPAQRSRLKHRAAQHYLRSGRVEQGLALTKQTLANVGVSYPNSRAAAIVSVLWQRASLRLRGCEFSPAAKGRPSRHGSSRVDRLEILGDVFPELYPVDSLTSTILQTRYLREALALGDPAKALWGLVWEVFNLSMLSGPKNEARADALLVVLKRLADIVATPYADAMKHFAEASRLVWSGHRYLDAIGPAVTAQHALSRHCRGAFWERSIASFMQLVCMDFTGDLREYATLAMEAVREASERDDRFSAMLMLLFIPNVHNIRNDPAAAMAFLDKQGMWLSPTYNTFRHLWLVRMLETSVHAGRPQDGVALLESERPAIRRGPIYRCRNPREVVVYEEARCLMAIYAKHPDARSRARASRAVDGLSGMQSIYGAWGHLLHANLSEAAGEHRQALDWATKSKNQFLACQAPLLAMYAERRTNQLLADDAAVRSVDQKLEQQGIVDPERWVWGESSISTMNEGTALGSLDRM